MRAATPGIIEDTYSSVGIVIGLLAMIALEGMDITAYWLDGAIASVFGVIILITGIRVVRIKASGFRHKFRFDQLGCIHF